MKNTLTKLSALVLTFLIIISVCIVPATFTVSAEDVYILPDSVDNSTSPYFPAIGNQGSMGSCTSWAHVYYSFTYAINRSRGIKTTPENTYSPQWSYNLTSNGEGEGSTAADIEWFLEKQGGVPLSMVPYEEDPVTWCSDLNVWRESINNRLADTVKYQNFGYTNSQVTSADDEDLAEVKTALAKGELLTFSTEIYSWVSTKLKTHKDAPGNAGFEGQEAVKYENGAEGSHAMTIVGYNDNIWVDINDNNQVDSGEMGAFKVANSWGDDYANDGFIWMAYDAVNKYSAVNGFDGPENRKMAVNHIEGVITRPYGDGTDVYIRYNFKTGNRRESFITITAEKDGTIYSYKAFFPLLTLTSGDAKIPYDGNMLVALDNVIPDISSKNFHDYNWSVSFADKYDDDYETTYNNAEIVIESTGEVIKPQNSYPFTLNGEEKTLEFCESTLNHAVVYYRGYMNPAISYKLSGETWMNSQLMDSNTEREGYVNKFVIDLKDKESADIFFLGEDGSKDDNDGKNFTVKKGINYFVTEGVAERMSVTLITDEAIERTMSHEYRTEVTGGYAPYTYQYIFKNLETGEEESTTPRRQDQEISRIINKTGKHLVTVIVTDFEGTVADASVEVEVIDSPFEFSEFKIANQGELFLGKTINFSIVSKYENIRRFGTLGEHYDITITKNGEVCHEGKVTPVTVDPNKMTSTFSYNWTPNEPGHYVAKVWGTDFGKDYAEKTVEFDIINKAYIYYRGYYSPVLNWENPDGTWNSKAMDVCTDVQGYVNMLDFDLGKEYYTRIYFSDSEGNKDNNDGEYYIVYAGKSYFVTENAAKPLTAGISSDKTEAECGDIFSFTAKVSGGYSPYTYNWKTENLTTGEITATESSGELVSFSEAFDKEGSYKVTITITDYAGKTAEAFAEVKVVAPAEATTTAPSMPSEVPSTASTPATTATVPATAMVTSTPDETEPASKPQMSSASVEDATHPTEIITEVAGIIGDANMDSKISIKDATVIQKYIANIAVGFDIDTDIADANRDTKVNIKDATIIQKYLAKFETENVGEELIRYTVVTLPIPTTTEAETTETATADETTIVSTVTEVQTTVPMTTAEPAEETSEVPTETQPVTATETTEATTATSARPTEEPSSTVTEPITAPVTEPDTTPDTEPPTEPDTEPEVRKVTFTNSFYWSGSINCYFWSDEDTGMSAWPGVAMQSVGNNDFGETMYTLDVPAGATWIIFTNGTSQTVDIQYSGGELRFYPTTSTNDKGHFIVEMW